MPPVDELRREDADDDGQLVDRHQPAAHLRRRDFGDVHRREVRGQADGHAAQHAPGDEDGEAAAPGALPSEVTAKSSAERISRRLRPKRSLSAPATSAPTRQPMQGATVGPALLGVAGQLEVPLEERLGPADHDPVVAEEQAAHRGDEADQPDEGHVVTHPVGRSRQRRNLLPLPNPYSCWMDARGPQTRPFCVWQPTHSHPDSVPPPRLDFHSIFGKAVLGYATRFRGAGEPWRHASGRMPGPIFFNRRGRRGTQRFRKKGMCGWELPQEEEIPYIGSLAGERKQR